MLPLAFDLVPQDRINGVVEFIKTRGMACSVYGAQYLMEGLYKAGAADYALDLMTATHDRSWWNMIALGSTITLEAWDMKYKPNSDWNHAWGAAPANIIPMQMWGITPLVPGGRVLQIKPQLSRLTQTDINVPTINGLVKASFKKVNNLLQRYTIELPPNVSAVLELPNKAGVELIVDGHTANMSFGDIRLSPGKHVVEFRVNTF